MIHKARAALSMTAVIALTFFCVNNARANPTRHAPFATSWINGTKSSEPQMQVQPYDDNTFVIRQSIATSRECPFLFLFFGKDKALLVDTGDGGLKIRPTIDNVISNWLAKNGRKSIPLVVAHTHSHPDHIAGDPEFAGDPNVTVVGLSPEEVETFFKISHWPEEIVQFDLGGRILDIVPSPGHEKAEVTLFDRNTHLLLTGDWLYPGRLYFKLDNFDAYSKSVDRVVKFTQPLKVSWILGAHIEMKRKAGRSFPMHAASHQNEHKLELPYARLIELQNALHKMGPTPALDIHRDFIIYPTY